MTMSVPTSTISYDYSNAPRNAQELALVGRFRLKELAKKIGLAETPEQRSALASCAPEALANDIAKQLARMDEAAGGPPPTAMAAPTPAALPAVPVAAPMAAPIPAIPTPVATPQAPAPALATRRPRVSAAAAAAPATPAAPAAAAPELLTAINAQQATIAALQAQVQQLAQQLQNVAAPVATLVGAFSEGAFQQKLNTALSLLLAEEVLHGDRPEILQMALGDMDDITALVGKVRAGK